MSVPASFFQPLFQEDPASSRRQALAQYLMQRGTSGQAKSPYDVLANMLNAYTGATMMKQGEQQFADRQEGVRNTLSEAMAAYRGDTPNYSPEGPQIPQIGIGANRQALVAELMKNPYTAGMASQLQLQQAFQPVEYATATVGVEGDPTQRQTVFYPTSNPSQIQPLGPSYAPKAQVEINQGGQPANERRNEQAENERISQQVGAPLAIRAPWSGISDPKKRDEAKIKFSMEADKKLDALSKAADGYSGVIGSIDRFLYLNEQNYTGKGMAFPGAKFVRGLADPEFEEMQSISDKLTPAMRQGMPGAASDRDVAMFRGATIGVDKSPEANRNIGMGLKVSKQNAVDMINYMKDFKVVNQHLEGAETLWKQYIEANPIFDPSANPGEYKLNENRMSYKQYFSIPQFVSPENAKYKALPSGSLYRDENGIVRRKR